MTDSIGATTTGSSSRCTSCFAWLAMTLALAGTLGSLALSWGLGLKACPLCFYQRTFVMAAFAILGVGLFVERARPGLICLLSVPMAWAGLGVAAFHEYLVLTNVLECPKALLGIGTAPAQSLAEFSAILNGPDLKRAKIAAELVPEPVLEDLVKDKRRLKAIRPSAEAPAYVRCPPLKVEQAELAELKRRGEPKEVLRCHRFWRGTNVNARDRDGNEFWSWGREDPRHEVRLTPFWLKATHVTRAEFALFDSIQECAWRNNLSKYAPEESCPVVDVSWYQSWCLAVWCGCEMPTDAQFEFGVRAGRDGEHDLFPQGDTASSFQFNCDGRHPFAGSNAGPDLGRMVPVRCRYPLQDGQPIENVDYRPNDWGIWQPVGQALVWCADWFDGEEYQRCHKKGLVMNPVGPESGRSRVRRGGAWYGSPTACRSAFRGWQPPVNRDDVTGLRLVCVRCVRTP